MMRKLTKLEAVRRIIKRDLVNAIVEDDLKKLMLLLDTMEFNILSRDIK